MTETDGELHAPSAGGGKRGAAPELRNQRGGQSGGSDAAVEGAAEERELNPSGDAGRGSEPRNSPKSGDAEPFRQLRCEEPAKCASDAHANQGETQRRARVA